MPLVSTASKGSGVHNGITPKSSGEISCLMSPKVLRNTKEASSGKISIGLTGPPAPAPSSSTHTVSSRLHTPVSMSQSRRSSGGATTVQRVAKGTAVGGSAEALESGVGTESTVDTTDSGPEDPSSDDSETSEEN